MLSWILCYQSVFHLSNSTACWSSAGSEGKPKPGRHTDLSQDELLFFLRSTWHCVLLEVCYYIKGLIFVSSADMWGHSVKESACQSRRHKRCGFPAEGNGNSLHYFCLEMFMDKEAIVQRVAKRWTQLTHTYIHTGIFYSSGTTLDSLYESESLPLCSFWLLHCNLWISTTVLSILMHLRYRVFNISAPST